MYTSDTDKLNASRKCFKVYLAVSVFVLVFSIVYEIFSHGVISLYMILAFLFPLILGALPFGIINFMKKNYYPDTIASNAYHAGVSTLTVGCIMKGVLDIYGTSSSLIPIYNIVGIVLIVFGFGWELFALRSKK